MDAVFDDLTRAVLAPSKTAWPTVALAGSLALGIAIGLGMAIDHVAADRPQPIKVHYGPDPILYPKEI
ncbi:hypothetical protein P9272_35900 [Mesorhizobium sp. WSM4976]|uniref:hypothetical protein n=1 Tax=Mesorhizobium sp. WSM4976 TaxID=3038549 RepID=UPI002417FD9F|nr:hypothetical protein [Mesorhizobium sp. WSM4976]MDG4898863.1 hypothetical protein [Mesorhizobium sp. WSM4976]